MKELICVYEKKERPIVTDAESIFEFMKDLKRPFLFLLPFQVRCLGCYWVIQSNEKDFLVKSFAHSENSEYCKNDFEAVFR